VLRIEGVSRHRRALATTATIGTMKMSLRNPSSAGFAVPAKKLLLLALVALLAACSRNAGDGKGSEAFWDATAFGLDDQPIALVKYRNQPLVVNFWARWCPPCRDEIPDFILAQQQFKSQGVQLVGIGIEDQAAPVSAFVREYGITYPVLLAKEQGLPLMEALGNHQGALPFTIVMDRQGYVVARKVGRMSKSEMDAAFAAALR
jgi:thiol-disulfide isomerase/thioredoxin